MLTCVGLIGMMIASPCGRRQRRHLARQREIRAVGIHLRELPGAPALLGDGRHQAVDVLDQLGQLDEAVAVEVAARQRIEQREGEDAVAAVALVGLLRGGGGRERGAAGGLDQAAQRRLLLETTARLRSLGQRARLAGVEHQHGLLGQNACEPGLQPVLADGIAHKRLLGVVAQVVGNEVVAPVESLAVTGGEEHEHVARTHLGGEVGKDLIELGGGGVAIEDMGDDHVLVVALARLLECGGQRLGVRDRIGEFQTGIEVVVDTDDQYVESRRRRRPRCRSR